LKRVLVLRGGAEGATIWGMCGHKCGYDELGGDEDRCEVGRVRNWRGVATGGLSEGNRFGVAGRDTEHIAGQSWARGITEHRLAMQGVASMGKAKGRVGRGE